MMIHVLFGVALSLCVIGLVVFRIHKGKSPGVMNIILLISAILLAWFTVTMIQLFKEFGMIPDTLVSCVFMALAGEAGVMGWIKTNKEKIPGSALAEGRPAADGGSRQAGGG